MRNRSKNEDISSKIFIIYKKMSNLFDRIDLNRFMHYSKVRIKVKVKFIILLFSQQQHISPSFNEQYFWQEHLVL